MPEHRNLSIIVGTAIEDHVLRMPCPYKRCDGHHSTILVSHIQHLLNTQPKPPSKSARIVAMKRARMLITHHAGDCPAVAVAVHVLDSEIHSLERNLGK